MKKRILSFLLLAALLVGFLTGCGDKAENPNNTPGSTSQAKPEAAQTKYAYQAEYTPLELAKHSVQYISSMATSGDQMFLLASCITGTEPVVDEATGEPYTDGNGNAVTMDITESRLFQIDLATKAVRQLDYLQRQPEEGKFGYCYTAGLTSASDGGIWFFDQMYGYHYELPEDFDPEQGSTYDHYVDDGISITCYHYNAQGEAVEIFPLAVEQGTYLSDIRFADDGSIYATDYNAIFRFDTQGQLVGTTSEESGITGINGFVNLKDGIGVAQWTEEGYSVCPLDAQTMTLGEAISMPSDVYDPMPGFGEYEYTYLKNAAVYGFSQGTEPEKLFSWIDCDVDYSNINSYRIMEDGTIYAVESVYDSKEGCNTYNLITLRQVDASTLPEKQILTLACLYLPWNLRTEIISFNKSHQDVRINVADYSEYATEEDYNAGIQKLNTEILSGVVPDIFYVDGSIPLDIYASRGILLDLWTLIDADAELSRDDLMTHFFDTISTNGKLYQITSSFGINTVVGRSDVIGSADSWTLEEMLKVYETLEEGASLMGEMDTREGMFYTILTRNSNRFIDWENSECSFNSQSFIDLLNLINQFPETFDYENYDWNDYSSEGLRMRMRKQLVQSVSLMCFTDVQYYDTMCDNLPNYIGVPTSDGNGSSFSIYGGLAISASCANVDAAWSFVRNRLTEEYQNENNGSFPTNRHAFEAYTENCMLPQYGDPSEYYGVSTAKRTAAALAVTEENADGEGETSEDQEIPRGSYWFDDNEIVNYYHLTQETYDRFMALYERTNAVASDNDSVNKIIEEECGAFFAGQKTAEETARLIQEKVTLYVYEQS